MSREQSTHTPLPWEARRQRHDHWEIWNDTPSYHAEVYGLDAGEAEATAAYIVRACNAYPALLQLAERVAEHFADTNAPLGEMARAAAEGGEG